MEMRKTNTELKIGNLKKNVKRKLSYYEKSRRRKLRLTLGVNWWRSEQETTFRQFIKIWKKSEVDENPNFY